MQNRCDSNAKPLQGQEPVWFRGCATHRTGRKMWHKQVAPNRRFCENVEIENKDFEHRQGYAPVTERLSKERGKGRPVHRFRPR